MDGNNNNNNSDDYDDTQEEEPKSDDAFDDDNSQQDDQTAGFCHNRSKKRRRRRKGPPKGVARGEYELCNDWNDVINGASRFLEKPLYTSVTAMELNSILGWATHVTTHQKQPQEAESRCENPLLDLPGPPLPASILYLIHESMTRAVRAETQTSQYVWEAYDQSALVSLGVCLEDMITATLLPLATAHVKRCRKRQTTSEEQNSQEEEPGWLLPPEECILELAKKERLDDDDPACFLPTAKPPTHAVLLSSSSSCAAKENQETIGGEENDDMSSISSPPFPADDQANVDPRQQAIHIWAEAHKLKPHFMDENKDIFGLLLGTNKGQEPHR